MSDNNQRVQKQVLGDIYLSSLIITDINLDDIGGGGSGGNVNIKIDDELNLSSNNPVKNSVITENFNKLSSLKLDKSEYETNNTNVSENIINLTENKVELSTFNENINNITENINNIIENKVELSTFNETITTIKENKIDLSVFNDKIGTINGIIVDLNTNKLDLSAYKVDEELNESSPNPVQNKAIRNEIYNIINRLSYLEYINNVKLSFSTNLEVFATRNDISSDTVSSKEVYIDRMFAQTNEWDISKNYLAGTIVTIYNDRDSSQIQDAKIYRALQEVSANTELSATEYWEDLTNKYFEKKTVTEIDKNGKEVSVEKYFHKFIEEVPAGTIQTLILKSETKPEDQNVIINWGDGTKTNLRAAIDENNTEGVTCTNDDGGYIYTCRHNYVSSLINDNGDPIESKYFMIEIIGNKFSILTSNETENIISNIFGDNMQFYLNCIDVEGLCKGSKKLLYVSCSDYNNAITSIRNAKSLFENCTNLQYAIGFYELTGINTMLSMERMFAGCKNMLNCDCRIAKSIATDENNSGNAAVYLNCENMSSRLRALLPTNGFDSRYVSLSETFKNCKNIYVVDKTNEELGEFNDIEHINNILFKDNSKIFINISETFSGCDLLNSINGFVPDSWKNS